MVSIWTQIEEIGSSSSFVWVLVPQIMQSFFYLINASELETSQLILIFLSRDFALTRNLKKVWRYSTIFQESNKYSNIVENFGIEKNIHESLAKNLEAGEY